MKKILLAVVLMVAASSANAAWCRAVSPYAWGEATAVTVDLACAAALQQCASRTPYGSTCYVVSSVY